MLKTAKRRSPARLVLYTLFAALFLGLGVGALPVQAAPRDGQNAPMTVGAKGFIDSMGQQALNFLADAKLGQTGKEQAFRKLLESSFDMNTIGRFALGQYWRQMTPAQQKEYLSLFRDHVVRVYSARFNDYKGQTFNTTGVRADNDTDSIVSSEIQQPQGEPVQVEWRVRYKGDRYQIVDVIVEGVSMTMTQRSDFSAVIQRGGGNVSVILDQLKNAG